MDIRCPKCGEPWDHDTLHEYAEDDGVSYTEKMREFQRVGCEAFHTSHSEVDETRAAAAGVLYEILGDDMDGAAAMLEDFDLMF